MAMEAHKLRFVRCPKCHQLLVEYPSIPVYECGGCGSVLRAKNRAVPVAPSGSESEEHNNFPSSLQGSPQNNKSSWSGEQKTVSSVDQPHEAAADGTIPCTVNDTNSCEAAIQERTMPVAENVIPAEHQSEETRAVVDDNTQNPRVMVTEIHEEHTGANSSSIVIEKVDDDANGGKVDNFGTTEVSTPHEKMEVIQREGRMHTYEGMHVKSHEALIEELERSLSFSSDDEYFTDEAENNGLSDALHHQMGSRRFMLRGKMNDVSRSDPHGRLIEELEMSFSDTEETMDKHAAVADRVHVNDHDKNLQTLGAESARPCELEMSFSDTEEKMDKHAAVADRVHVNDHDKNPQTRGSESAHPCEESLSSFDDGHLKSEQTSHQENRLIDNGNQGKEDIEDDNNTANYVHGNVHIVVADEDIAERLHDEEDNKDRQFPEAESPYPCEGNVSCVNDGKIKQSFQPNALTADGTQEMEDGCMEDENMTNYVHEDLLFSDDGKIKQSFQPTDLTTDGIQEKKECCMEDDNMTNNGHGNENLVFQDEDTAERLHGNEELTADHTHEESHMEDDDTPTYVQGNEIVAVVDEHIVGRVDKNEHSKDQQSMEAESVHLCEGIISSLNTGHTKSEQSFEQNRLIADGSKEEEDDMEGGSTTNHVQEDSATVASFSSLSNKRSQYKLPSCYKNKEDMLYKYIARQLQQGLSLDAEDFKSIQNFMESQIEGTSSSVSSGSPCQGDLVHRMSNKFNNIVRHERLRKMDELRDQLSRLSSQKGLERRYQKRGLECQQQSNSYDVEQHLQSVDADSVSNSCALESYYGHGRPPRYQPSTSFSPTRTYAHSHFGHAPPHIPHNYDAWEFSSYYQSSYAESTILDHESFKSTFKEQKRVVRKHILRPLSGASPFSICNSCFNLVQMPSDIHISKAKIGKMQCGQCSKVLALSFPVVCLAERNIIKEVAPQSNKRAGSIVTKNENATSHSAEYLRGPVSINEEPGASFTRSFSTQAGSSLVATQSGKKASDSALHRLMGYETASQLLRHSRVFEDGYDNFESMVPVSSRVSRRKNK